jgi:hypothetical protein
MIVLSHRGWWLDPAEKNTATAFHRSFTEGYGTETDIRDYQGELVISHNIADISSMKAEDFFVLYKKYGDGLPLALNIKADGLQQKLKNILLQYNIKNYFIFDMSVPDGLQYLKYDITSFTRQSEYERIPSFYNEASGVWLDEFLGPWITQEIITQHIKNKKKICIVSPDLHKRDHIAEWSYYKKFEKTFETDTLMLCTDYPEDARRFFSE